MPFVERKRRPYALLEKVRPWAIGFAIAAALGGLFIFLGTRGPGKPQSASGSAGTGAVEKTDQDAALARIAAEVSESENTWRQAVEKEGESSATARTALAKAVELQREYVRRDVRASVREAERLRSFEAALGALDARDKSARVELLEREAAAARGAGRGAEAIEKLREAIVVQEAINRTNAPAAAKDFSRENRLRGEVELLEAEPLSAVVARALAAAESAVKAERWDEARAAFTEARAAQGRINREYGRTRFADRALEERLAGEVASLAAAATAQIVTEKVAAAEAAIRAGQQEEAGKLFGEAKSAQEEVNANHPQSRFVSAQRAQELEARRQTALSAPPLAKLRALDRGAAGALRAGDTKAAGTKIGETADLAARVWKEFPRSRELEAELRERVDYLKARGENLAAIHEDVSARVIALPASTVKLLRTEVPQALYARVMDANPSRQVGEARPVDSVSWADAREFCRKLSWVLGRGVRLPTEVEVQGALADSAAFADLRDGLAEWLDATAASETAPIIDADGSLASRGKTERSRQVGFRVVVE